MIRNELTAYMLTRNTLSIWEELGLLNPVTFHIFCGNHSSIEELNYKFDPHKYDKETSPVGDVVIRFVKKMPHDYCRRLPPLASDEMLGGLCITKKDSLLSEIYVSIENRTVPDFIVYERLQHEMRHLWQHFTQYKGDLEQDAVYFETAY
ncbi:MAG: hypothetical protein GY862_32690 [Gammaproteobacteria bacterium]|nr:hypothetical protein [Gammaproteobacteria bacterium]